MCVLEAKKRTAVHENLQDSEKGPPRRDIGKEPVCGFDLLKIVNEKAMRMVILGNTPVLNAREICSGRLANKKKSVKADVVAWHLLELLVRFAEPWGQSIHQDVDNHERPN